MTALATLIETALYTKLTGNASLAALATGGVYEALAPASVTNNWVVFQYTGGGDMNTSPRRDVNVVYRVEFVSTDKATARTGAGHIDTALHNAELTIAGWENYRMVAEDLFAQTDTVDGKQYYRRGSFFRIRVDQV